MPLVNFASLPDSARAWVFGAASPLNEEAQSRLLVAVDAYLSQWKAHGVPLVCAHDWRDDRFLAVAVDEAATDASGCSIDGMFRVLVALQSELGTSLVGGGNVFWRDQSGAIVRGERFDFINAAARGEITATTMVFDATIASVGQWRTSFEKPASNSWHAKMLPPAHRSSN